MVYTNEGYLLLDWYDGHRESLKRHDLSFVMFKMRLVIFKNKAVIDWLTYYNHRRLHSTLGYISPMQFEKNWFAAQLKKAA
jgi:hypothetical protein